MRKKIVNMEACWSQQVNNKYYVYEMPPKDASKAKPAKNPKTPKAKGK